MITKKQYAEFKERAAKMIKDAGFPLSEQELNKMDVADFGLGRLETEGAQIVPVLDTDKVAMRIIALIPWQTEPEHWHTGTGNYAGKEETIRVISGELYLCKEGEDTLCVAKIPYGKENVYTAKHEYVMKPCDSVFIPAGIKHWFQAGKQGAVILSTSSTAHDAFDPFTDPAVSRVTVINN